MILHNRDADDPDEPLDPAAERVRQKLARLLIGSFGIMVLGLAAVFAAILYKVAIQPGRTSPAAEAQGETVHSRVALPSGAALVSTSLDGEHALLQFRNSDGSEGLLFVDLRSGHVISRQDIVGE